MAKKKKTPIYENPIIFPKREVSVELKQGPLQISEEITRRIRESKTPYISPPPPTLLSERIASASAPITGSLLFRAGEQAGDIIFSEETADLISRLGPSVQDAYQKANETLAKVQVYKAQVERYIALYSRLEAAYLLNRNRGDSKFRSVGKGLVGLLADNIGNIRGLLIVKVREQIAKIVDKYAGSLCPSVNETKKVIRTKNNLSKVISKFDQRVTQVARIVTTINASIRVFDLIIKLQLNNPKPVFIVPGVPYVSPVTEGSLNKRARNIQYLQKKSDQLKEELKAAEDILRTVRDFSTSLQNSLNLIDFYLQRCLLEQASDPEAQRLLEGLSNIEDLLKEVQPPNSQQALTEDYGDYKITVVQDETSIGIAPKRYAIAQDRQGVVVLRGQSSFSSDSQILIDELKFRIDNKLA